MVGPGSSTLVISQVYGGGGNTGAPFNRDFVEIFNRGSSPVDLAGWSVQYASATGTGNFATNPVATLSGTIQPKQYLLLGLASGAVGATLPTPDFSGTANMSGTGGKVALVNTATGLACNGGSVPCSAAQLAQIVDLVGWGSANFFEGAAAAPVTTSATTALRKGGGCTDTDDNSADFTAASPNPRNTSSPLNDCAEAAPVVSGTVPANLTDAVALSADISITFSEAVNLAGNPFTLSCTSTGTHTTVVTGGPQTFTLNPESDFSSGEKCTLTLAAAGVSDQDAADPPDNLPADYSLSFFTGATRIHHVQGASHVSPLEGFAVIQVPGIVTAKTRNSFYFQDGSPDASDATSEGLLVFTSSAPTVNVGDAVMVSGKVTEFRPGGSGGSENLTITELIAPTVAVASSGNSLPAATVIGAGGRVPPTNVIDDDAFASFQPESDGIDFYESLEGMLVQVNNPVAVGSSVNFGEIPVLADNGAGAGLRTTRGGIVIRENDFNPERIILDDALTAGSTPSANVGDHFSAPAVGILDYAFANYKLLLTSALTTVSDGVAREAASEPAAGQLTVATFNVENLDPGDGPSKFNALANLIVANLKSPDLLALEEVQDNYGATNDGTTDASLTLNTLVGAIAAAGGPTYQYRQINPVNNQDGGEPGGNIRVAFMFRSDRGLAFVDRAGGTATNSTSVAGSAGSTQLTLSPGRINPDSPAFTNSRKPLAGEFIYRGQKLFVIANHFNSKGGDQPLFGRYQPPALTSEKQRLDQAAIVAGFVSSILAKNPAANVVVLGDLNDFQFSAPLATLKNAGLTTLIETLTASEQYTYVFDGNSQALDHTLTSAAATNKLALYDVVHVNSEFASRVSDHDPQVSYFNVPAAAVLSVPGQVILKDKSPSVTPVTVLSTPSLDATTINPATATAGNGIGVETPVARRNDGSYQTELRDVDLDGDLDLTLMFATAEFVANKDLKAGTNTLYFYGLLYDNLTQVVGSAQVRAK